MYFEKFLKKPYKTIKESISSHAADLFDSKSTQSALGLSNVTRGALEGNFEHLKGTRRALEHLRRSGTRLALGHSGTWRALGHLGTHTPGYLGTLGTLFIRPLLKWQIIQIFSLAMWLRWQMRGWNSAIYIPVSLKQNKKFCSTRFIEEKELPAW